MVDAEPPTCSNSRFAHLPPTNQARWTPDSRSAAPRTPRFSRRVRLRASSSAKSTSPVSAPRAMPDVAELTRTIAAFASCAEGRTVSVTWKCRKEFHKMQDCMKI